MIKKIPLFSSFFILLSSLAILKVTQIEKTTSVKGVYQPIVVLELFTSQGCSSCPPADVLLDQMKQQYPNDVFALSYHVDYWNYIGWQDPFSQAQFTRKQNEYNTKFRYSSNYTPELVVNGKEHVVGSNQAKVQAKIKQYRQEKSLNQIHLKSTSKEGKTISFDYQIAGDISDKMIRAVLVLDEKTTVVKRGENRNRTLKNANIVVKEKYIPLDALIGKASFEIPPQITSKDKLHLVVLVENTYLDITAAAKTAL